VSLQSAAESYPCAGLPQRSW